MTPKERGNSLEFAVASLEGSILKASPSYTEKTFAIELQKQAVVEGVRHEIDVWVVADLGPGYEAIFIFECKNWKQTVGKNEVIIFSEKIRAVRAQKGIFVAKRFSRHARAQAKLDPRIVLQTVSEEPPFSPDLLDAIKGVEVVGTNAEFLFSLPKRSSGADHQAINMNTAMFLLNGKPVPVRDYANEWIKPIAAHLIRMFQVKGAAAGDHHLEFDERRDFAEGVAFFEGEIALGARVHGHVHLKVHSAKIVSSFDLPTRGRIVTVRVEISGVVLQGAFIRRSAEK